MQKIFRTFVCDAGFEDGSFLVADYSIDCNSAEHRPYKIWAGICIALYPIGQSPRFNSKRTKLRDWTPQYSGCNQLTRGRPQVTSVSTRLCPPEL
jgi:hypothetical protein